MFDISGWLKPHIIKPLKNHIYPHSFKHYLGKNGKAYGKSLQVENKQKTFSRPLLYIHVNSFVVVPDCEHLFLDHRRKNQSKDSREKTQAVERKEKKKAAHQDKENSKPKRRGRPPQKNQ